MQWQKLLESCVSETKSVRLEKLVHDTENAVYRRFRELSTEPHPSNETQALRKAAEKLAELKIEKLGWCDPAKPSSNSLEVCGCGRQDVPLNLYKVSREGTAERLKNEYSLLPCGFAIGKGRGIPSYGILLCNKCVQRLTVPLAKLLATAGA